MVNWDDLRWFVTFAATADRWLWSFEADGWLLYCGNPAHSSLAVLPPEGSGRSPATVDDARWLADVFAFDHDAPIGIWPAMDGQDPPSPIDPAASPQVQPVHPLEGSWTRWYWEHLQMAYGAAAENRFNGSCVLRYDPDDEESPSTDFTARFAGREELVGLYAMAARQVDPLSEYLCLYRLLEAADKKNGKTFIAKNLGGLQTKPFGDLRVIPDELGAEYDDAPNAFEVYRERATAEIDRLTAAGTHIAGHLYKHPQTAWLMGSTTP
jgi:hypothetical protein